jgi:hypothetical protein
MTLVTTSLERPAILNSANTADFWIPENRYMGYCPRASFSGFTVSSPATADVVSRRPQPAPEPPREVGSLTTWGTNPPGFVTSADPDLDAPCPTGRLALTQQPVAADQTVIVPSAPRYPFS